VIWTPAKRLELKIETIRQLMDDCQTEEELGQKMYDILGCNLNVLHCQQRGQQFGKFMVDDIKEQIESADEMLLELNEAEPEMMTGWYFGSTPKNDAWAFANLLAQIRVDLLVALGMHLSSPYWAIPN
jgi:hypothetical protein